MIEERLADSNGIARRRVSEVLGITGLSDVAGQRVGTFSLGMNQMAQTADHLLVIGRGRIIADASTAEFVNRNSAPAVQVRAVQQSLLADALSRRGAVLENGPGGALVVTGLDAAAIGYSRSRPRHRPARAGHSQRHARGGLLRPDPRRNRLPRRPAGRFKQGDLT